MNSRVKENYVAFRKPFVPIDSLNPIKLLTIRKLLAAVVLNFTSKPVDLLTNSR